jgi:Protein of unknown function (DUF3445)
MQLDRVSIQVPYSMRPDLRLMEKALAFCEWTPDSSQACQEKLDLYEGWLAEPSKAAQTVCAVADAQPQVAMEYLLALFEAEQSQWRIEFNAQKLPVLWRVVVDDELRLQLDCSSDREWRAVSGNSRLCAHVNAVPPEMRLWLALGFVLHEDLVLLRKGVGSPSQLEAECLHVSFPSGWTPAEKLGQSFAKIHAPVADASILQAASGAIGRALLERGPFERFVWTISDTDQRARFPMQHLTETKATHPLWLRVERQVSLPLRDLERSLFLIRVFLYPLEQVFEDVQMKKRILASLSSMSDAVVAYKGLEQIRARLTLSQ